MPFFPHLTCQNGEFTARTTGASSFAEWFNPSYNPFFGTDSRPDQFTPLSINYGMMKSLCQAFIREDNYIDIASFTQRGNVGDVLDIHRKLMKIVWDNMPTEHRWMMPFFQYDLYQNPTRNQTKYQIMLRKIAGTAYSEVIKDSSKIYLLLHANDDDSHLASPIRNWTPSESALATFVRELRSITDQWATVAPTILNRTFYVTDSFVPHFMRNLIMFVHDCPMFYPTNGISGSDWTKPSTLLESIRNGSVFTIRASASGHQVSFIRTPTKNDRAMLETVLGYSTNILDLLPYSIKETKDASAPLYGIELEACGDYTSKQMINFQKELFFILKQDSSISGSKLNKYEIVTVPATMRAHKRLWAEFFEAVDYNSFDTTKNTGNGMHIHIDRKAFDKTKGHLNRMCWFITNPANNDFIYLISERPSKQNMMEWASVPSYNSAKTRLDGSKKAVQINGGMRGAFHCKSTKTVEIRLFKGIVSYATVIKNLEFVDSLFEYTRIHTLSQISVASYLQWLAKTETNRYQLLKSFLKESRADELVPGIQVSEFIWLETQDVKIAEKLNKANFPITNHHITYLNRKRKRRTFILKDGTVQCVLSNGGLLAKLDKSQQQKQTRGTSSFSISPL